MIGFEEQGRYAHGLAAQNMAPQPREGVLTRMDGIADSLQGLADKLTHLGARLTGAGSGENKAPGHPPGIDGVLSAAEARLRECHQLVGALHETF